MPRAYLVVAFPSSDGGFFNEQVQDRARAWHGSVWFIMA